jgi:hypothetical protein
MRLFLNSLLHKRKNIHASFSIAQWCQPAQITIYNLTATFLQEQVIRWGRRGDGVTRIAQRSSLVVAPPAEPRRVKGRETDLSTSICYHRAVQTVETDLSMVRMSPFSSMVPMMSELSIGGLDPV